MIANTEDNIKYDPLKMVGRSTLPRVNEPPGIQKGDYLYNGVLFDLKTIEGNGKNTIYGSIHKKNQQAHSFIIDISKTSLNKEDAVRQIHQSVFRSKHTRFVDTVILIRDLKVLGIYERI